MTILDKILGFLKHTEVDAEKLLAEVKDFVVTNKTSIVEPLILKVADEYKALEGHDKLATVIAGVLEAIPHMPLALAIALAVKIVSLLETEVQSIYDGLKAAGQV